MDLWTEVWLPFVRVTDSLCRKHRRDDGRVLATHVTTETRHWLLVCAARRITGLKGAGFREDTGRDEVGVVYPTTGR